MRLTEKRNPLSVIREISRKKLSISTYFPKLSLSSSTMEEGGSGLEGIAHINFLIFFVLWNSNFRIFGEFVF